MHRKYLERIVENGTKSDMKCLADLMVMSMDRLKELDEEMYKKIEMKMYEMAYGKNLTEEMAEKWVSKMIPRAKWTYEETTNVLKQYDLDIKPISFYVIMNMLYSDMKNLLGDGESEESISNYITAAKDWYFDDDVENGDEKLYDYWKYIAN